MPEIVAAAIGVLFLQMFFKAVNTQWPTSYYSLNDPMGFRISLHPIGYAMFRFGPVLLVSFFVAAVVRNQGRNAALAVLALVVVHLALSIGRAFFTVSTAVERSAFSRASLLLQYGLVAIGVCLTAVIGVALGAGTSLRSTIPSLREISASLWTAVFAATIGAYILRLSDGQEHDIAELIRHARSTIPAEAQQAAKDAAREFRAEPLLVETVLIAESLQRPAWVRALERLKGRVLPKGSYGVMQAYSDKPISDVESVRLAVANRLAGASIPRGEYDSVEIETLRRVLRRYHPREGFVDLAEQIYVQLDNELAASRYEREHGGG